MRPLDDPRWVDLYRPEAAQRIRQRVRARERGEPDPWGDLYDEVCHQGTPELAAYAVLPHLVTLGRVLELAAIVGDVFEAGGVPDAPDWLDQAWRWTLPRAAALVRARFLAGGDAPDDARILLRTLVQLDGRARLAHGLFELIGGADEVTAVCESCGDGWDMIAVSTLATAGPADAAADLAARAGYPWLAAEVQALLSIRCEGCDLPAYADDER